MAVRRTREDLEQAFQGPSNLSPELLDRVCELGLLVSLAGLLGKSERCRDDHDMHAWKWVVRVRTHRFSCARLHVVLPRVARATMHSNGNTGPQHSTLALTLWLGRGWITLPISYSSPADNGRRRFYMNCPLGRRG